MLTDPAGEVPLDDLETSLRGGPVDWPEMVHDAKRHVADTDLSPEVRRIARETGEAGVSTGSTTDAVAEVLACFPVYRSYLPEGREHLDQALAAARGHRPDLASELDALAPVLGDPSSPPALRVQQTSGMVMAKGVEDQSFYRWSRLTSLNEVGADPATFAVSPDAFHTAMVERQRDWPTAMTTLSTHDTKRSEDVRARLAVLAEVPGLWRDALTRLLDLAPVPDPGFGSLLWQAALGARPIERERLHAYAEKAMREAGDHTGWLSPDQAYESAVHAAVDASYDDPAVGAVLDGLLDVVLEPGRSNALAAKLVALTMPGVPDVYQGTELWDLSLVDPDNRRPVDFDLRRRVLAGDDAEGAAKLRVVRQALTLRRDRPELFTSYTPVPAEGPAADHVLAFDRGGAVTVVTRLPVGLSARGRLGRHRAPAPRRPDRGRRRPGRRAGGPAGAAVSRFDVWAPYAGRVRLSIDTETLEMRQRDGGWWTTTEPLPVGEVDYGYLLDDDETPLPDPRSRRQPDGVHGRSRTFDAAAYAWTDGPGPDASSPVPSSTSSTSARSRPRARSTPRSAGSTTCATSASTWSSCCRSTR